jgi:hypothetical protein
MIGSNLYRWRADLTEGCKVVWSCLLRFERDWLRVLLLSLCRLVQTGRASTAE